MPGVPKVATMSCSWDEVTRPDAVTVAMPGTTRSAAGFGGPAYPTRGTKPLRKSANSRAMEALAGALGQTLLRSLTRWVDRQPHLEQNNVLPLLRDQMVCELMAERARQGRLRRLTSHLAILQHAQHATKPPGICTMSCFVFLRAPERALGLEGLDRLSGDASYCPLLICTKIRPMYFPK